VIEANAVAFTYPGQATPALTDITITLRAGQVIALVGENGSGKSTLAKLLTGLYLPDTGTITWNGTDIATLDPAALHPHIAVVMQDPTQWPMTAANNIRIGRIHTPDPDGYRLTEAAARAGADTVLADLPDGPNTMLTRRFHSGRDLSGGEWQRISVARALYRDASLIVADEPTAALDAKAEHAVFATLRQLPTSAAISTRTRVEDTDARQQRITVLITHRLANVRTADHIIVLDRGHLAAQGTHNQLMAQPGTYRDLFTLQARSYRGEQPCTRCTSR
jgi:ATP-binding cassette subfamily B protein